MIFTPELANDVIKYFKGSYVKFPETGDYLCTVDQVDEGRILGKIFSPDKDGMWAARPYQQPLFGGIEIDFVLPRKGFFNFQGSAHLLTRIPARQYRKGVCGENTTVSYLGPNGGWKNATIGFDVLTAYVNKQQYLPFDKHEGVHSYAVSPRMAATAKGFILVDKALVGVYDHKKKIITARNESFADEIRKVVACHGQALPVTVGQLPKSEEEKVNIPVDPKGIDSLNPLFTSFVKTI